MSWTWRTPPEGVLSAALDSIDVHINGPRPWDLRIHDKRLAARLLAGGSLALGESYADGWWDCERVDELIARILRSGLDGRARRWLPRRLVQWLGPGLGRWRNRQSEARATDVALAHYDRGNGLFEAMLGPTMAYSCGYWATASTLDEAQTDKLELICRKLQLQPGMRLLDIGCGWGSLLRHAAQRHGVEAVGLTVSVEQAHWARAHLGGLPVRVELADYRAYNRGGQERFDRIASVGMFEHVGLKNHRPFFDLAARSLHPHGLFLLHTIGKRQSGVPIDPWIERHVFPNGELPSLREIAQSVEGRFEVEDLHSFGADYDRTLMAWLARFDAAWPALREQHDERFRRRWRYYLMACAGTFRARDNALWQWVLSPHGVPGGYRRPLM